MVVWSHLVKVENQVEFTNVVKECIWFGIRNV